MSEDNIWLAGRRQEHDALGRIIPNLEHARPADGTGRAVRGAGVDARIEAITGELARGDRRARQPRQPAPSRRPQEHRRPSASRQGLREMIRTNEQITFRGLAQTAGVSLNFLSLRADLPTCRTPAGPTAEHPATSGDHDPPGRCEQRRSHPHLAAERAQAMTPGRGPAAATGPRSRPGRDLPPAPPPGPPPRYRAPSPSRRPTPRLVITDRGPHALDATDVETVNCSLADASVNGWPAQTRD